MQKTKLLEIFNDRSDAWVQHYIGSADIHYFKQEYHELPLRRYWELLGMCESYHP